MTQDATQLLAAVNRLAAHGIAILNSAGDFLELSFGKVLRLFAQTGRTGQGQNEFRLATTAFARGTQPRFGNALRQTAGQGARQLAGSPFNVQERAPQRETVLVVGGGHNNADNFLLRSSRVEAGKRDSGLTPDPFRLVLRG